MKRIAWVILLIVVILAAVLVVVRVSPAKDVEGTKAGEQAAETVTPQKDTEQVSNQENTGNHKVDGNESEDPLSEVAETADEAGDHPEAETPTEITVTDEFVIEVDDTENVDGF